MLTVTPGGAALVVAPVDTDTVFDDADGVPDDPLGAWTEPVGGESTVGDCVGVALPDGGVAASEGLVEDPDELVVDDPDVSADANPYPVITAAPTPKATAKPPTRPTCAAALTSRVSTRRVV